MSRSFILIFFLLVGAAGFSQEYGSIKGHIMDGEMQDEPLLFAQVSLKNTAYSTETDFYGDFEFDHIESGEYILTINYLGYETLEVPISVKNNLLTVVDKSLEAKSVDMIEISASENNSSPTTSSILITSELDR